MSLQIQTSTDEFQNEIIREIDVNFEEYETRLSVTNWEWHLADAENLETEKSTYEAMVSYMEALRAKYYDNAILFAKIKKFHNQYAPTKYQIP